MNTRILCRVAALITIALVLSMPGQTQTSTPMRFVGIVDDFTAALDSSGPWQISGEWVLLLKASSGKADFSVPINMVRADSTTRSAHTHHVVLSDAVVTTLSNGFSISGNAIITSNGSVAGFSGSQVDVLVTGGDTLPYSNITLTFGGGAASHFGDQPFHGVVTQRQ
jgi:hypothetical protein